MEYHALCEYIKSYLAEKLIMEDDSVIISRYWSNVWYSEHSTKLYNKIELIDMIQNNPSDKLKVEVYQIVGEIIS